MPPAKKRSLVPTFESHSQGVTTEEGQRASKRRATKSITKDSPEKEASPNRNRGPRGKCRAATNSSDDRDIVDAALIEKVKPTCITESNPDFKAETASATASGSTTPTASTKRRRSGRAGARTGAGAGAETPKSTSSASATASMSKTTYTSRPVEPTTTKPKTKRIVKQASPSISSIKNREAANAGEKSNTAPTNTHGAVPELASRDSQHSPRQYWLMKAEPNSRFEKGKDMKFSIDDLIALNGPAAWDGVRNYAARNHMRAMRKGDFAFFYHSNCKEPGIVGVMEIIEEATPDETAFDPKEPYYDPKSNIDSPKWVIVKVEFRRKLSRLIGLAELKSHASGWDGAAKGRELKDMALLKQSRLSVSPVSQEEWEFILSLEEGEKIEIGESGESSQKQAKSRKESLVMY